jgi:hypothetical protein
MVSCIKLQDQEPQVTARNIPPSKKTKTGAPAAGCGGSSAADKNHETGMSGASGAASRSSAAAGASSHFAAGGSSATAGVSASASVATQRPESTELEKAKDEKKKKKKKTPKEEMSKEEFVLKGVVQEVVNVVGPTEEVEVDLIIVQLPNGKFVVTQLSQLVQLRFAVETCVSQYQALSEEDEDVDYEYTRDAGLQTFEIYGCTVIDQYNHALAALTSSYHPVVITEQRHPRDIFGEVLGSCCGKCSTWFKLVIVGGATAPCPLSAISNMHWRPISRRGMDRHPRRQGIILGRFLVLVLLVVVEALSRRQESRDRDEWCSWCC